ncbi:ArsR/SmtB family transcription factor [Sciscionella sediminilitoris]|uniref:ArsR/SmtB family transcription factor n=1 Tax=Sciscionella sediminilitoris TaxID=1445613 RepID=UPI0004DF3ECE|nr:DUF5937 family protein [Sciscionella sp. SE31]
MAVTLLLPEDRAPNLTVRISALAELCAALHALCESEHHPVSASWAGEVRELASPELLAECDVWAPLFGAKRARFFYPLDACGNRTLEEEFEAIERLPVAEFAVLAIEAIAEQRAPSPQPVEPQERSALLEHARRLSHYRLALLERLFADPSRTRDDLLSFLRACTDQVFARQWQREAEVLEADLRTRERDVRVHGFGALPRIPTAAATELREPSRIRFDKLYHVIVEVNRPCVLIPSVHGTPHVVLKYVPDLPIVIQYPVADRGAAPNSGLVTRRLTVLTDPARIALCRMLVRGPHSTSDLAEQTGMTGPQVSRHLRQLREVGLVHTRRAGKLVYYTLDIEAVGKVGGDFVHSLLR